MKILVINSPRQKCGIVDYINNLYVPEIVNKQANFELKIVQNSLTEILSAPFFHPQIIHLQHEFSIFDNFKGLSALFYLFYLRFFGLIFGYKIVTTLHTAYNLDKTELAKTIPYTSFLLKLVRFYLFLSYKVIILTCFRVIILNQQNYQNFIKYFTSPKIVFVDFGIYNQPTLKLSDQELETKKADICQQFNLNPSLKYLTLFGFARSGKGFEIAISALKKLKDEGNNGFRLLIISSIPKSTEKSYEYFESIKNQIAENDLQNEVVFTDFIEDNSLQLYWLFQLTHLFIFPYTIGSGASAAIAKVIWAKKPIICSNITTFSGLDYVEYFETQNPDDLAKKVLELTDNTVLYEQIKAKISLEYSKNNMDQIFAKHLNLFEI